MLANSPSTENTGRASSFAGCVAVHIVADSDSDSASNSDSDSDSAGWQLGTAMVSPRAHTRSSPFGRIVDNTGVSAGDCPARWNIVRVHPLDSAGAAARRPFLRSPDRSRTHLLSSSAERASDVADDAAGPGVPLPTWHRQSDSLRLPTPDRARKSDACSILCRVRRTHHRTTTAGGASKRLVVVVVVVCFFWWVLVDGPFIDLHTYPSWRSKVSTCRVVRCVAIFFYPGGGGAAKTKTSQKKAKYHVLQRPT